MILRTGAIALLCILSLTGCSTREALIWKAQDVSLSEFNTFVIQSVFNATGKPLKQGTTSFLRAHLKEQFAKQNLQVSDSPQTNSGVLLVQIDILAFDLYSKIPSGQLGAWARARKATCRLRTRLLNKRTTQIVAEIITKYEYGEIMYKEENYARLVKKSAVGVAKEVAKLMQ